MPFGRLLVGTRERQPGEIGKRSAGDLQPIGSPEVVKPQGTEMVGSPRTSKGAVLRMGSGYFNPPFASTLSEIFAGRTGTVGVIRRSTAAKVFLISLRNSSSWRRDWA